MESRLYVGNLTDDVSIEGLRQRFAEIGPVADVELATDRASGRMRGHAFVTMANPADAQAAAKKLNGSLFDDRRLRVNVAGAESDRSRSKAPERARITSQFRERLNMAYELDCGGVALVVRLFPEDPREQSWRVEATIKDGPTMAAAGATRAAAVEELVRSIQTRAASPFYGLDWPAVTEALANVRAI